jgi:hypothetical protein
MKKTLCGLLLGISLSASGSSNIEISTEKQPFLVKKIEQIKEDVDRIFKKNTIPVYQNYILHPVSKNKKPCLQYNCINIFPYSVKIDNKSLNETVNFSIRNSNNNIEYEVHSINFFMNDQQSEIESKNALMAGMLHQITGYGLIKFIAENKNASKEEIITFGEGLTHALTEYMLKEEYPELNIPKRRDGKYNLVDDVLEFMETRNLTPRELYSMFNSNPYKLYQEIISIH